MKIKALIGATLAAAALNSVQPAISAPTQVEGTVLSVDRDSRTFRLRDSERGTFRIRVARSTSFERIAGFGGLRRGLTAVEATLRRSHGRWVAIHVERSGGGGRHGGRN